VFVNYVFEMIPLRGKKRKKKGVVGSCSTGQLLAHANIMAITVVSNEVCIVAARMLILVCNK